MKILKETRAPETFIPTKPLVLVEGKGDGRKAWVIEGIFGKINCKNENNRRYPKAVWDRNLAEGSPFRSRLKMRTVLGELEHPESGNTHLERVSHIITDAWIENLAEAKIAELGLAEMGVKPGEYVLGRYEILNTPRGGILKALHEAGVKVGISSRGRGDVKQVDGIDEVQDNYVLDTWDAVYLPSVSEAYPGPRMTERDGDLGSQLPKATQDAGVKELTPPGGLPATAARDMDVTGTNTVNNWKAEAEQIVRKLEVAVGEDERDIAELIELFPRGIDLIDRLAPMDDPEAIKLKSQALTLIRILADKVMKKELARSTGGEEGEGGGEEGSSRSAPSSEKKSSSSGEKKSSPSGSSEKKGEKTTAEKEREEKAEKAEKEKKEKEEKAEKEKKEKAKKESVEEGTMRDLASTVAKSIKGTPRQRLMWRGDLEAELNKAGHPSNEATITQLAAELKAQGVNVDQVRYEALHEATEADLKAVVDGTIVSIPAKKLLAHMKECPEAELEVVTFLEKQEGDVLVRVCSKGNKKFVVRLLEPAFGESNIVLEYEQMKSSETNPQPSEKEEDMNVKEMMAALVTENDQLKQQLGDGGGGVPEVRYEAAKKLIAGLVERVKAVQAELVHEKKRVKAAAKLIHKMTSQAKGKKDESLEQPPPPTPVLVEKKEEPKAAPAVPVSKTVEQVTETLIRSMRTQPASEASAPAPVLVEKKEKAKQPDKVTQESKDLVKRVTTAGKAAAAPVTEARGSNLMSATVRRLHS